MAVMTALSVVIVQVGSPNRVLGSSLAFAVAALLLVANALTWRRFGWAGALLYGAASLGLLYGIVLGLFVPFRLAIEGKCPLDTASCPLGFEYPLSGGEDVAASLAVAGGAIALVFVFIGFEFRHMFGGRVRPEPANLGPRAQGHLAGDRLER
jgi:hypothetical protein